jgi:hypothetical protein
LLVVVVVVVLLLLFFQDKWNFVANHIFFRYHSTQDLLDRALLEVFQIHRVVVHIE